MELLLKLLPRYYEHVERYPHTLLIKFFGLHRVTTPGGRRVPLPSGPRGPPAHHKTATHRIARLLRRAVHLLLQHAPLVF